MREKKKRKKKESNKGRNGKKEHDAYRRGYLPKYVFVILGFISHKLLGA